MLRKSKSLAVLMLIGFSLLGCETSQSVEKVNDEVRWTSRRNNTSTNDSPSTEFGAQNKQSESSCKEISEEAARYTQSLDSKIKRSGKINHNNGSQWLPELMKGYQLSDYAYQCTGSEDFKKLKNSYFTVIREIQAASSQQQPNRTPKSSSNRLTSGQKAFLEQLHPECKELYRSTRDDVQALECHKSNLNHDSIKKMLEYYR